MLKNKMILIDPLAVLLPSKVYQIIIEKFHPHVPRVTELQEVFATLPPTTVREIAASAKQMLEITNTVADAAAKAAGKAKGAIA